jgi:7-carboxy-7-deazaguanine synthase
MKISEIFYSLQGEGVYAGLPMIFIRTQGCNLAELYGGCVWCDTRYAQYSHQGEERSIAEILEEVEKYPALWVCLTGGEPLYQAEAVGELLSALKERGYRVEVETNGSLPLPSLEGADCWVVDVKCPSSGMAGYTCWSVLTALRPQDQVKFVIQDRRDFDYSLEVLRHHPLKAQVVFSPVWGSSPQQLARWVKEVPQARLSLQLHKLLWGERRGV